MNLKLKNGDLINFYYLWGKTETREAVGFVYNNGDSVGASCKEGGVFNTEISDIFKITKIKQK